MVAAKRQDEGDKRLDKEVAKRNSWSLIGSRSTAHLGIKRAH